MKNNLEDLSRELYTIVMQLGDMPNSEMEVIHHLAHKLQPQLDTTEQIHKALVNMFLLGQVGFPEIIDFTNQNKDE